MRKLLFLLRKEFRQIRRNPFLMRGVIAVPIVQMLILVPAVTFELKRIDLAVVDHDRSQASRELISRLQGSTFFVVTATPSTVAESEEMLFSGEAGMALIIPSGFSRELTRPGSPKLQVLVDAVNATSARLAWNYLAGVVSSFNRDMVAASGLIPEMATGSGMVPEMVALSSGSPPGLSVAPRYWYNPLLNYKYYMLPGVLVILVTAIGLMIAGLSLMREKESGTIEQLNVTPVMKWQLTASRMIPFFIIGLIDLAIGLGIGWLAFRIPFEGSLLLFFACAAIFLVAVIGLALFLSARTSNSQQFLFMGYFFVMILILMSGIFTPTESMPLWAQQFNVVNPVAYLMRINRMIMLKGSGFHDIAADMGMLALLAVAFLVLAVSSYRKRE